MADPKKKRRTVQDQAEKLDASRGYPWGELYQIIVGQFGISPSEYWKMTPGEIDLVMDSKRPKIVNGIHEDDLDRMLERRQKMIDEGLGVL